MKIVDNKFIQFLVATPVSQVNPSYVSDKIRKIHLESEQFKAATLFESYHPDLDVKQLKKYHSAIPMQMGKYADQLLIQYFFDGIVLVEEQLSKAKDNFVQAEKIKS